MGLDVWFKDDVRNILLGMDVATAHLTSHCGTPEGRAYRDGFEAALAGIAISFGIGPQEVIIRSVPTDSETTLITIEDR